MTQFLFFVLASPALLAVDNCNARRREDSGIPDASTGDGVWRTPQAEVPPPGVSSPGLFVTQPSSGTPGGHALADRPPLKIAKFEERVLYEHGPAQVGIGDLLD